MNIPLTDFPKLHCPFIRQTFKVSKESYRKNGRKHNLRKPEVYLAVDRINPGYQWVFDDPDTFAVEKLDGSNVKVLTRDGTIAAVQNRLNVIDPLAVDKTINLYIMEGINRAGQKKYLQADGEQAGELLGPKFQANPYQLDSHLWYPFERSLTQLRYKSFDNHDRNYDNWSSCFKDYLTSLFFQKITKKPTDSPVYAEGVVFYNLKRKEAGQVWMAKLRRNMFPWFYSRVEIMDYDKAGRDETEDQETFD